MQNNCSTTTLFAACSVKNACTPNDRVMFNPSMCCCKDSDSLAVVMREECAACISDSWLGWSSSELTGCLMSLVPHPPPPPELPYPPVNYNTELSDDCLLCLVGRGFVCSSATSHHYSIDWTDCNLDCWRSVFAAAPCLQTANACVAQGRCDAPYGHAAVKSHKRAVSLLTHVVLACLLLCSSILNVIFALTIHRKRRARQPFKVLRFKRNPHVSGGGDGGTDGGGSGGPVV